MPIVAYYAGPAKAVLDRLDERTQEKVRRAVRNLISNPSAGYWIAESLGATLRMIPLDGWRVFYTVWETELTITEILPAADSPAFPA